MNKQIFPLLVMILLPLMLVSGVYAAPNSASLKLYPFEGDLEIGTEYAIEIRVFTENNDVDAADVDFSFTPSMGTFRDGESTKAGVNAEEGSAFTSFIANSIGSSSGIITAYRTDTPLNTGETGYSVLGTLYFTPTTTGTFSITYSFTQDLTTDSNVVQSVTSNDILTSVRNATFTIVEAGGMTPTPTPTSTSGSSSSSSSDSSSSSSSSGSSSSSSSDSGSGTTSTDTNVVQQDQPEIAQEDLPVDVGQGDEPVIVDEEKFESPFFWEEQDRVLDASRITLVGSIMSYALIYGFQDFVFLFYRIVIGILRLLRIYHNPRRWGVVYDSHTKLPLGNVLLKLIHAHTGHVQYAVSDVDGRFGFVIDEGKYRIECSKRGYEFPSDSLKGKHEDHQYHELYFGSEIELHNQEVVSMDIPLDPLKKAENRPQILQYILIRYVRPHAMKVLYGISLLISAYIAIMTRSPLDVILFFLLLLFMFDSVFVRGSLKRGVILSETTGKRLPGLKVTLKKDGKTRYLFYTDDLGEYFLVCQNGTYDISMEAHGHIRHRGKVTVNTGYLNSHVEI